jgi:hypothetical protein
VTQPRTLPTVSGSGQSRTNTHDRVTTSASSPGDLTTPPAAGSTACPRREQALALSSVFMLSSNSRLSRFRSTSRPPREPLPVSRLRRLSDGDPGPGRQVGSVHLRIRLQRQTDPSVEQLALATATGSTLLALTLSGRSAAWAHAVRNWRPYRGAAASSRTTIHPAPGLRRPDLRAATRLGGIGRLLRRYVRRARPHRNTLVIPDLLGFSASMRPPGGHPWQGRLSAAIWRQRQQPAR